MNDLFTLTAPTQADYNRQYVEALTTLLLVLVGMGGNMPVVAYTHKVYGKQAYQLVGVSLSENGQIVFQLAFPFAKPRASQYGTVWSAEETFMVYARKDDSARAASFKKATEQHYAKVVL